MLDKITLTHQLDQLKRAYLSGVLRVRYGDSDITYQSMPDMKKAIDQLERSLGHKSSKISLFTIDYDKGL